MSVTCQNVPGSPPTFQIVWEVEPGNEARLFYDWTAGSLVVECRSHNLCLLELLQQQIGKLWSRPGHRRKQEVRGRSVGRTRRKGQGVPNTVTVRLRKPPVPSYVYTHLIPYICLSETSLVGFLYRAELIVTMFGTPTLTVHPLGASSDQSVCK